MTKTKKPAAIALPQYVKTKSLLIAFYVKSLCTVLVQKKLFFSGF